MNTNQTKKTLDRSTGIGGSDATYLVEGEWLKLYQIKKGVWEQEDLSFVLPVQLGIHTESFNREWFMAMNDMNVQEQEGTFVHKEYDYIYANVDGFVLSNELKPIGIFEAKHTNAFMKEDKVIDKYYAQIQHYMMVTKMNQAWLSVIFGNLKYKSYHIQQDKEFQKRLLIAEKLFWEHMVSDNEPADHVDFDAITGGTK